MNAIAEVPAAGGLTSETAAQRLVEYGSNDPAPRKRRSAVAEFVRLFSNPLVLVLLFAAAASAALDQVADAAIILAIVILSNTLDFAQTRRSQKAVEQLQAQVAPKATAVSYTHLTLPTN